jgi:hypothetical protein
MTNRGVKDLRYVWDVRPAHVPLTPQEVEIALELAEYEVVRAAEILRVPLDRLQGVLRSDSYAYLRHRVHYKLAPIPITVREDGLQTIITIKRPTYPFDAVGRQNTAGDLELIITRKTAIVDHLRRTAEHVLEDSGSQKAKPAQD